MLCIMKNNKKKLLVAAYDYNVAGYKQCIKCVFPTYKQILGDSLSLKEQYKLPPTEGSPPSLQTDSELWTLSLIWPLHHCGQLKCCVIN